MASCDALIRTDRADAADAVPEEGAVVDEHRRRPQQSGDARFPAAPRPAARINGVVPVASPTLAAGRSPRETYRGFVRAVFSRESGGDRDPPIVPIVLGEDAERRFREKQPEKELSPGDGSLASAAARAAVAGSAVSAKLPGGASPSASSASHTHRASRASFSAAECSSVPPSPSGDRGQARVELNGGGRANASPMTERIVSAASVLPRRSETCSAFPIASVEAQEKKCALSSSPSCASRASAETHGPPRSKRRHFHARAAHARFRSARREGTPRAAKGDWAPRERRASSSSARVASRSVSSSSAKNEASSRACGPAS